jgi:hypothetical protein
LATANPQVILDGERSMVPRRRTVPGGGRAVEVTP